MTPSSHSPRLRRPIWWRRIHWRLMASYLLLAGFVIFTIWFVLRAALEQAFESSRAGSLLREARLVAQLLPLRGTDEQDEAAQRPSTHEEIHQEVLHAITPASKALEAYIALLNPDGSLIAQASALPEPPHHTNTADIAQALRDGEGWQFDIANNGEMRLVVCLRLSDGRLLRLARSMGDIDAAHQPVWTTLALASVVAVIVAGMLGFIASRFFTKPLSEMGLMALRIARGDFSSRIDYPLADELGLLGDSLDHLSSELSEKIRLLTEEKTRLATILGSMAEGVLVVDGQGRVGLINQAAQRMFGLQSADLTGKNIEEVVSTPELLRALERTRTRRSPTVEECLIHRRNERRDMLISSAPIEEHGRLLGVVAVLNDISQVRRLERIRRDFVANVSHELRTPLTVVRGYAETLLNANMDLPEMAVEFVETILRHTIRLSRLIDDLLTLAAIEGRGLDAHLGPTSTEEVIDEVIDLLSKLAEDRQISVTVNTPPVPLARAEPRALRHVLTNLLDNAIKYTPEGGHVEITTTHHPDAHTITISVSDTGHGIPPQHLPRIFERFYRVDEGRSRDVGGSGLGLALVKHLVHTLGASIDVKSTVGQGTTFTLTLACA